MGADLDDTHATSFDYSYTTHILTPSGGTLLEHGIFGQADVSLGPVRFFAGIRHQFTGQHGETFVSPNGGVAVGAKQFRFRASGIPQLPCADTKRTLPQFSSRQCGDNRESGAHPGGSDGGRNRGRLDGRRLANLTDCFPERA